MLTDKEIYHYNEIVDYIEKSDTLCKEDNKWFAIGYLYALSRISGVITPNERYHILQTLIAQEVI